MCATTARVSASSSSDWPSTRPMQCACVLLKSRIELGSLERRPSCGHLDLERNQQAWASGTMVRSGPPAPYSLYLRLDHSARLSNSSTLRHPLHSQLSTFPRTVQQIQIDQLLVRQSRLFRQSLEIVHDFGAQIDSHRLFFPCVRVLHFLQFGKVIFLPH